MLRYHADVEEAVRRARQEVEARRARVHRPACPEAALSSHPQQGARGRRDGAGRIAQPAQLHRVFRPLEALDADVSEPYEPWFFQRALRYLCLHRSCPSPPLSSRVHRPWERGVAMHRYMSCQIWKYDDEEHGSVIAKVMTKDGNHRGIDVIFCKRWTSCRGFAAIRTSSGWWTLMPITTRWP